MKLHFRWIFRKLFLSFCLVYLLITASIFLFEWLIQREDLLIMNLIDVFLLKWEFLSPLAVLIALIHTLSSMKMHHEILALQSFGISKSSIAIPIFTFCLLLIPLFYLNTEYLLPLAKPYLSQEKVDHIDLPSAFLVKQLDDGTTIAYQIQDGEIHDLYWIHSHNHIWHAKSVSFDNGAIIGHWVDRITKDNQGRMTKSDSYEQHTLPISLIDPSDHTISRLADKRYFQTQSCYKIANALLPLLFATILLPTFLRYSREVRPYLIHLVALIAYLLVFSLLKTFIILGQNYVVAPIFSLILFPLGLEAIFFYRLCKHSM